jgi:hypothetical protein
MGAGRRREPVSNPFELAETRAVRYRGIPAILTISFESEERWDGVLMTWWNGDGATRVLAQDEEALLLKRAMGATSLADMARNGCDDDASRIMVARLHAKRDCPPPELIPLSRWFEPLEPAALAHGGLLRSAAAFARELLDAPEDVVACTAIFITAICSMPAGAGGWPSIQNDSWASVGSTMPIFFAIQTGTPLRRHNVCFDSIRRRPNSRLGSRAFAEHGSSPGLVCRRSGYWKMGRSLT